MLCICHLRKVVAQLEPPAIKPFKQHEHVLMLIKMAAKENDNVKNFVQTLVQHQAFRDTNNLILTASNPEQSTYIVLIVLAEIPERKGSIQLLWTTANYCHKC